MQHDTGYNENSAVEALALHSLRRAESQETECFRAQDRVCTALKGESSSKRKARDRPLVVG
jgi:hypothetical protein